MITELSVKNYRSLKDMKLSFGPLTVLIGANGSGKSNILDVLKLLKQLITEERKTTGGFDEEPGEFDDRGGYEELVWGGGQEREISVKVSADHSGPDAVANVYEARFGRNEHGQAGFLSEKLERSGADSIRRGETKWSHKGSSGSAELYESALGRAGVKQWPIPNIIESMRDWAFYRFNPEVMRPPQKVRKEYRLVENGENLSTVIHTLFSDGDPALDEIVDVLKACVRTVEDLVSPIYGDAQTYVALKEKSVPSPVGSWGLSDGTLLSLALAAALVTPDRPSLIALEAPDIELHPYVMQTLAEMLTIASGHTQVVVTTHSPYLLDFLSPESFVVVEKTDGATTCRSLRDEQDVQKALAELGAGTVWHSGDIGGVP